MKAITTDNIQYPTRNPRALLAELESQEERRMAAKATMAKKAEFYRKAIHVSFVMACLTNIIVMCFLLIYCITENQIFTPVIMGIGLLMTASFLVSFATFVAKKIWEHKLLRLGIIPPD